jgi:hypothetical protein
MASNRGVRFPLAWPLDLRAPPGVLIDHPGDLSNRIFIVLPTHRRPQKNPLAGAFL